MKEEFDNIFEDIKLNFDKNNDINEKKINILAEQMALNEYVINEDEDNATELYSDLINKYSNTESNQNGKG